MALKVLFEDNQIIVVYKERGILSQSDKSNDLDLLTIVKDYIKVKYNKPGNVYLGLVHRLDRNTSGIMVFARTSKAASRLSDEIRNHNFKKKYLAVVEGKLVKDDVLINYLSKDEKLLKADEDPNGKIAKLSYHVLKTNDKESYLDIELETGRYHQIRCQMSLINHPLVGDHLYGSKVNIPYILEAYYLSFYHPVTKEELVFNLCDDDKIKYIDEILKKQ